VAHVHCSMPPVVLAVQTVPIVLIDGKARMQQIVQIFSVMTQIDHENFSSKLLNLGTPKVVKSLNLECDKLTKMISKYKVIFF